MIFILNYYGYFSLKFQKYNLIPVHHSIKPLIDTFIYATTGLYLASLDLINKIIVYRKRLLPLLFLIIFCIIKYYHQIINKYYYLYNLLVDILGVSLILFFSLLPLDKINNLFIQSFFNHITNFTGGVYFISK